MDSILIRTTADVVRARIAELVLPASPATADLGSVRLQPHQEDAVARIGAAVREFGGALLADETGLGKTFVALAIARRAARPLVVAPAALREMWRGAMQSARIEARFVSAEALSRGWHHGGDEPDLVVVDECHHFRNPGTARYRALATLTARAQVLLLSATPVHNSEQDLAALLALFLGARASALDPAWTSRCIVRRSPRDVPAAVRPHVLPPEPLRIDHDERPLEAILALPPPLPPVDGGDGGALLTYSLLRQWASTRASLTEALRRRLARATALLAGLEAGSHPSASELAAWSFADGAVQLAFPELVIDRAHQVVAVSDLAAAVHAHADAVRLLLADLAAGADPDVARANHLVAVRRRHDGEKIVVFSQFAESVSAMFRLLRREPGVAALTADRGLVAGGSLGRSEVLARFAPRAQGARDPHRAGRIDILLTTDLLSEGVNLQDASVVVHLDVPWTPARLDQRVGRVARMGSAQERIAVYAMLPPAGAERVVRVEDRLREKLGVATRTVGVAGTIIPSLTLAAFVSQASDRDSRGDASAIRPASADADLQAPAESNEEIHALLAGWRSVVEARGPLDRVATSAPGRCIPEPNRTASAAGSGQRCLVAAVSSPRPGFIAVIGEAAPARLLADLGSGLSDAPATVLRALRAAGAHDIPVEAATVDGAVNAVGHWCSARSIRRDLSVDGALHARSRRSVVDRIAAITRRAPRHLRPAIAALAATARRTVTARYGAGAERVLGELAAAPMSDEAWLRAVTAFGSIHAPPSSSVRTDAEPREPLLALLLLVPPAPEPALPPVARSGPER